MVESSIARIEKLDPALRSLITLNVAEARLEADLDVRKGLRLGHLHGLRMIIKGAFEVLGIPCIAVTPQLCEHRPRQSAGAVKRLQNTGAIVLIETNMPMITRDIQTHDRLFGTIDNR